MDHGKFVISLDFELYWGMFDKTSLDDYGQNISNVHEVVPALLECFEDYGVRATWATVGLLFHHDFKSLKSHKPAHLPSYDDPTLSPYGEVIDGLEDGSHLEKYYLAPELIELIKSYPSQELSTHTYSHYYCLESSQTAEEFADDLQAAIDIASENSDAISSIVFPRNQYNPTYTDILKEKGIKAYRGVERSWVYKPKPKDRQSPIQRLVRLTDNYLNLTGPNTYSDAEMKEDDIVNIPASRFLRPYSSKLKSLDSLRINRIKKAMQHAAKSNNTFHLWWHPHNFGSNREENFAILTEILDEYISLNEKYGFRSYTMSELAEKILENERV